jgi:hypothetical protein
MIMYALRDTRSGRFLKNFSGSFSRFEWYAGYTLEKDLGRKPTVEELHSTLWCQDTPNDAKLYKTIGGVKTAHHSVRKNPIEGKSPRYVTVPLNESCPWMEIVKVEVAVKPTSKDAFLLKVLDEAWSTVTSNIVQDGLAGAHDRIGGMTSEEVKVHYPKYNESFDPNLVGDDFNDDVADQVMKDVGDLLERLRKEAE